MRCVLLLLFQAWDLKLNVVFSSSDPVTANFLGTLGSLEKNLHLFQRRTVSPVSESVTAAISGT
jgi:hypothetical protein